MNNTSSKGKEIKIPGPDHSITISPTEGKVRVTVAGRVVAESTRALRLEEKGYPPVYYLPRDDADMSLLVRTTHYTYCPVAVGTIIADRPPHRSARALISACGSYLG
jgi:uncharacterized protein (DUF427 family)